MKGRWLLGVGLAASTLAFAGLVGLHLWGADAVREAYFSVDPQTGLLVERASPFYGPVLKVGRASQDYTLGLVGLGFAGVFACVLGLWRRRAELVWMTAPLWIAAVLGLGHALLSAYPAHFVFDWLVREPLHLRGGCMPVLDGCSEIRGLEALRRWSVVLASLATLVLIPAGRRAWRRGQEGQRLGRGWSRACLLGLVGGALALFATRGHRADRLEVAERCAASDWQRVAQQATGPAATPRVDNWYSAEVNAAPLEIEAREVPLSACTSERSPELQMFADGTLTRSPTPGLHRSIDELEDFAEVDPEQLMRERVELAEARGETLEPWVRSLSLYVDTRVPSPVLAASLERLARAGFEQLVFYGVAEIEDELATAGAWRQRVYCELQTIALPKPRPREVVLPRTTLR